MNLKKNLRRYFPKMQLGSVKKRLQLDHGRDWVSDRRAEAVEYLGMTENELSDLEKEVALDSVEFREDRMCADFRGVDESDPRALIGAYRNSSRFYILRLMLAFDRVAQALPFVNLMLRRAPGGRMLDYGCGAADTGLVFNLFGYDVGICDVEGGNLDFARWRFERRDIPVRAYAASETEMYPDLGRGHDFIAALEILEHLPRPSIALERIHASLKPGGLFVVREKSFEETRDGDHLRTAYEEYVGGAYGRVRDELFRDVTSRHGRRYRGSKYMKLYEKK